jgi:hypothetical protein
MLERDSPRDQFVVTLFLLTVFGLLLGAGVKNRILKAGFTPELPWRRNNARWWEVSWFIEQDSYSKNLTSGFCSLGFLEGKKNWKVHRWELRVSG